MSTPDTRELKEPRPKKVTSIFWFIFFLFLFFSFSFFEAIRCDKTLVSSWVGSHVSCVSACCAHQMQSSYLAFDKDSTHPDTSCPVDAVFSVVDFCQITDWTFCNFSPCVLCFHFSLFISAFNPQWLDALGKRSKCPMQREENNVFFVCLYSFKLKACKHHTHPVQMSRPFSS